MIKILIASKNTEETAKFKSDLEQTFEVFSIAAPDYPKEALSIFDLVLIDHGFTEHSGIDYVGEVINTAHIPVLMLAPPDDSNCAIEAIRAGAFNYIVKSGRYEEILPTAINEAISRFNEQKEMKATIVALKKRIAELEELLGAMPQKTVATSCESSSGKSGSKNMDIVKEIVSRFKQGEINLPSLPKINMKFQELIDRGADYGQIAELLKQDLAIASKLIMVSNSPFYRGIEINKTMEQAVSRLGIGVTQQYVNVISNRALYTVGQKKYLPVIERLWQHSLACAHACQIIAKLPEQRAEFENDPFIMGLLHDIGKLILVQVISELEGKGKFGTEIPAQEMMNITEAYHGQFGSALLKRWQFSNGCVGAALYHDNLQDADPISKELLIVHFANLLVKGLGFVFTDGSIPDIETCESAQLLKIGPEAIASIRKDISTYMEDVGKILS
jgi:HD-like signal output (HDOD) protein/AmiR/NasT family two-component response regulator